jgi:hypothetical protein
VKQPPAELAVSNTIRSLGVDDWAWRKGQRYGTILVDLDLHRVRDLLEDRSSESLASWLQVHSGISAVARDRSGLYAEGASLGAPDAQQVADRFHLVLNLSSAIERVFEERTRELVLPPEAQSEAATEADLQLTASANTTVSTSQMRQQQRRERRLHRYEAVMALYKKGYSQRAISNELGIGRKTIRRWLRTGEFPERKSPQRRPAKVRTLQCVLPSPGRVFNVVSRMRCSNSGVSTRGDRFRRRVPATALMPSLANAARKANTVGREIFN